MTARLQAYRRKRNFRLTSEPEGRKAAGRRSSPRFVVQKHAATRLHYDFRLELDGTLKSWAVPKGIPLEHGEKRLAIQVEDHPVDYIDFEGTIPAGQYGAGTVMVWDHGVYSTRAEDPAEALESGSVHFTLYGTKLKGDWHLVRMRQKDQWLLIRGGDSQRLSRRQDDTSVKSGRTMRQLAAARNGATLGANHTPADRAASSDRRARLRAKAPLPGFVRPMLARLVSAPPAGEWLYEIKFDGYRILAMKSGDEVRLLSRNELDLTKHFPEVAAAVAKLPVRTAILDGEIVALDPAGLSSFQLLQASEVSARRPAIHFYAFDLPHLDGADLRSEPLTDRKARLEALLSKARGVIRFSAIIGSDSRKLLAKARTLGLEGLIGKKPDSTYESGRRTGAWIKLKLHQEQELVIGGYTDPNRTRKNFGALLVGFYERGALRFAGKVGTGFADATLSALHSKLVALAQSECPFTNLRGPRRGGSAITIPAAELKRCHWVKPTLVGQVKFSSWTRDGKLRQPVFLGLREDKDPREVVRERAVAS